jgi:CDP-diacylglycerol---glycerol-3-phosphate 3-phosphatidyltransferase
MLDSLPNLITLIRILLIPIVVGLFYLDKPLGYLAAAALFIIACLTDFLDGYVARAYKQVTSLGSFLDPLADKLLVAAVLMMLAGFNRLPGISLVPAIIILCREILVSGLREFLGKVNADLPVTELAKWKTGLQMTSLACLIIADPDSIFSFVLYIGLAGLWLAALLTLVSGYDYLKQSLKYMKV